MVMLKEGRSFRSISDEFGINAERLKYLWILYQTEGESVLRRKRPIKVSEKLKLQIVSDVNKNNLTLVSASLKYGVSARRLSFWLKVAREQGLDDHQRCQKHSPKNAKNQAAGLLRCKQRKGKKLYEKIRTCQHQKPQDRFSCCRRCRFQYRHLQCKSLQIVHSNIMLKV